MIVGFVFIEVEDVVVATWTEAFCVDLHFSFTSFACRELRLPIYFLVASITEPFGMMFFVLFAIHTLFYNHAKIKRSHIKNFVQTCQIRSFNDGRTSYNAYCANVCGF